MGAGGGGCDAVCQKILLCMLCAAYDLLAQDTAQRRWLRDGNPLHPDFKNRQAGRLVAIQIAVDACFVAIGKTAVGGKPTMKGLSDQLMDLSKPRSLSHDVQVLLISKSEIMETAIDENQEDYLNEVDYKAA